MWRQNAYVGNSDSDQSISDEELNGDLGDNFISLNSNTRKETQQGLLHQRLEILGGTNFATSSYEKKSSLSVEDEVEMPDFPNEDGFISSQRKKSACHPDEDIISEEDDFSLLNYSIIAGARILNKDNKLNKFVSEKQDEACSWSMINKEAEAYENALSSGSSYKVNKSCKGVRGKVKPKFSLCPNSRKDGDSRCFLSSDENIELSDYVSEELEAIDGGTTENVNSEYSEGRNIETEKHFNILPAKVQASGAGLIQHPVAELLDGLQDKNVLLGENSKMFRRTKGKESQFVLDKITSSVGDAIVDNEDGPELLYSGFLGDIEMKKQTMTDRFQEAFAATSFSYDGGLFTTAKLTGIGFFGKLQHVMESEKERDANFLTKIQMGAGCNDEPRSIVVKILSRYLQAKLIVCLCSVSEHTEGLFSESFQTILDRGMRRTVIFNTKVCSDFDLEVGNFIRLHPPWKEVEMIDSHESIILSRYFSHVTE